jgi:RsiG-like
MDVDDRLLRAELLDGLATRPIDEVRRLRAECVEVETGLSYLRRMVQGPLDIVHREQQRRRAGTEGDLSTLVDELPDVLAEHTRGTGVGRLPQTLEPTKVDPALEIELDRLVGGGRIAAVTAMDDAALDDLAEGLTAFERKISEQRHAYFERIDALQAELTRRYRTGEASVESLLDS